MTASTVDRVACEPILDLTDLDLTTPEGRATWLEARRHGIGGSDAAAIVGHDPYRSPLAVWADKLGAPDDFEGNRFTEWGNRLEPVVAQKFAEDTGYTLCEPSAMFRSKAHPFMFATADRLIGSPYPIHAEGLVEIKTGREARAEEWEDVDDAPPKYVLQTLHYLTVLGLEVGWLVVLLGGSDYRVRRVDFDIDLAQWLVEQEAAFWRHVVDGTQPPADDSEATEAWIAARYQAPIVDTVDLPADVAALLDERAELKAKAKEAVAAARECDNRIKAAIGDAEAGVIDGEIAARWSPVRALDEDRLRAERPDLFYRYLAGLDAARLKAEHPAVYQHFLTSVGHRRLTVPKTRKAVV